MDRVVGVIRRGKECICNSFIFLIDSIELGG